MCYTLRTLGRPISYPYTKNTIVNNWVTYPQAPIGGHIFYFKFGIIIKSASHATPVFNLLLRVAHSSMLSVRKLLQSNSEWPPF